MKQVSKQQLRQQIFRQRLSLSSEERQTKSMKIADRLQNHFLFARSTTILAYFSFRGEPDLSCLFLNNSEIEWGFPRCKGKSLTWHYWQSGDLLVPGKYGILEPHLDSTKIEPSSVDLILVPSVACDRQKYRLGYGGGYYDRLLKSPEWSQIPTIGIVFDFAYLTQLPTDSWDIQLNCICTESTIDCSLN
jgi:5-formyltetrahydrofolate cyclo-ligase